MSLVTIIQSVGYTYTIRRQLKDAGPIYRLAWTLAQRTKQTHLIITLLKGVTKVSGKVVPRIEPIVCNF